MATLHEAEAYADVVRECQEVTELRDEEAGRPASELFDREDAEKAIAGLDALLDLYRLLVAREKEGG